MISPESSNFNRLLVSAGSALLAAAVTVPWLVLRENSALLVNRETLDGLTPVGRRAVEHRQNVALTLSTWVPWVAVGAGLLGLALLLWGAIRLYRMQSHEDRTAEANAKRAEAEADVAVRALVEVQTPEDRRAALEEEAAASVGEEVAEQLAGARPGGSSESPVVSPTPTREEVVRRADRASEVSDLVMARLQAALGATHSVRSGVSVRSADGREGLMLDGLVQRLHSYDEPDYIVEIKATSSFVPAGTLKATDQAIANAVRYERATGRPAKPWVVIVLVPDPRKAVLVPSSPPRVRTAEALREQLGNRMVDGRLDVIREADLPSWSPSTDEPA